MSIPVPTRSTVWKSFNGRSMDGKCFCCDSNINYENFHCGHISPRSKNGNLHPSNLRPICASCNTSMGNRHMYEYMLLFSTKGCKNISTWFSSDPEIKFAKSLVDSILRTEQKLEDLYSSKVILKKEKDSISRKIRSKNKTISERVSIMEEVSVRHSSFFSSETIEKRLKSLSLK
jgi:hypothetical protein